GNTGRPVSLGAVSAGTIHVYSFTTASERSARSVGTVERVPATVNGNSNHGRRRPEPDGGGTSGGLLLDGRLLEGHRLPVAVLPDVDAGEQEGAAGVLATDRALGVGAAGHDRGVAVEADLEVGDLVRGDLDVAALERGHGLGLVPQLAVAV